MQNLTEYTETDDAGRYVVTQHEVAVTDLDTDESNQRVFFDWGAGFFGDTFIHDFDFNISSDASGSGIVYPWALSNVLQDQQYWDSNNSEAISIGWFQDTLYLTDSETSIDTSAGVSVGTRYYPRVIRNGQSCQCFLYDDAARTNLLDTLSVTLTAARAYRYSFAANAYGAAGFGAHPLSATINNLNFHHTPRKAHHRRLMGASQ